MVSKMYGAQVPRPNNVTQVGPQHAPEQQKARGTGKTEFQRILQQKSGRVDFSGHALKRMEQRDMQLTTEEVDRLNEAVDRASDKGSKESLVLLNGMAFVVSVANRTVITAIGMDSMKENVVTNIDSAVIA